MTQVNELSDKGMICPKSSPFLSLVLLVQKKDVSYHMCVDYHALNKNTIEIDFQSPKLKLFFIDYKELATTIKLILKSRTIK